MPVPLLLSFLQRSTEECPSSIYFADVANVQRDVDGFISRQWPYDVVFPSLRCWFLGLLSEDKAAICSDDIVLLVELLIRQQTIKSVAKLWGRGGEKAFLKTIRVIVANLNDNFSHLQEIENPYTTRKLR